MTRLTTFADANAVAERTAVEIARQLLDARDQRGVAHLALSGGSTPAQTYHLLASALADWTAVEVWFADERCVPPTDEQSNFRLANETLLKAANIEPVSIHRMQAELGPDEGARLYTVELRARVAPGKHDLPILDVVVLGIGPDGHVASLFPGSSALEASEQTICLGIHDSPKPPPQRVTLSLSMLREARHCVLLATGPSKAQAVSAMLGPPNHQIPASLLRRERLTVIVDDAAAPRALG